VLKLKKFLLGWVWPNTYH